LGKSAQWISQRLGLNRIDNTTILELINNGQITLSNAYALAKLPPEEMANFIDRAMTQAPDEFIPLVNSRVAEIKKAKREGQDAAQVQFQPVAHLRKLKELKDEMEKKEIGPELVKILKIKTPADAFNVAIQWMLHLDAQSVELQKADFEAREQAKKDEANKRKVEREKKRVKAAEEKADYARKVMANAEATTKGEPLPYPDLKKAAAPEAPALVTT